MHRADILARIDPPAPEEVMAKTIEMQTFQRRRREQGSAAGGMPPPASDTLMLMAELEKAHVRQRRALESGALPRPVGGCAPPPRACR